MVLKDIVVGLDGSTASAHALSWATALAESTSSSIRGVSAWQFPVATPWSTLTAMPSQASVAAELAEQIKASLAQYDIPADFDYETREGSAGPMLQRASRVADLLVIGRSGHGQGPIKRRVSEFVLGSAARYCLHHLGGPVAVVPATQGWVSEPTVIVGVDGSPASIAALRWAAEHLPLNAKIHAVTAVPPYKEGLLALDPQILDRIVEADDRELDEAIAVAIEPLSAGSATRIAPMVVVDTARQALSNPGFPVDLVVVGERGRGALGSRLLGSVADHTTRYAKCPVIVVPADSGE